jgi:transcriptional regulator with XRE-family HTH domain
MAEDKGEIAGRVRVLREIEGVTMEALAKELGFDLEDYRSWESGAAEFPVGPLVELAGRFRVDLTELVMGAPSRLKTYCLTRAAQGPEVIRRPMYTYWNLVACHVSNSG